MPVYAYRCEQCGVDFDRLFLVHSGAHIKSTKCPQCGQQALRTYAGVFVSTPSVSNDSELLEDELPYRRMHYYEKKRDWDSAARAAEGVSEFARKRFLEKAEKDQN